MTPSPDTPTFFLAPDGSRQGPEPWGTVQARIGAAQIPPDVLVWWADEPGWVAAASVTDGVAAPPPAQAAPAPVETPPTGTAPTGTAPAGPGAGGGASDQLMSGYADQELDDRFLEIVKRSWDIYKSSEHATSIDETMLAGIICALVDSGFVLIDLNTAGAAPVVTTTTTTTTAPAQPTVATDAASMAGAHQLRFEEPGAGHRVTVKLDHITSDPASAKVLGQLAAVVIGYGERVPEFARVGQAIRQELASSFIASPEPGTVSWDADISSGYVYAEIDLIMDLDDYVDEKLDVHQDTLRRDLASILNTLRTFVRVRFGR